MRAPNSNATYAPPEQRVKLLPRTSLAKRLNDASKPLTLAIAAPGFGKTTLLSQWAAQPGSRSAWINLTPADSVPEMFVSSLLQGLAIAKVPLTPTPYGKESERRPIDQLSALLSGLDEQNQSLAVVLDAFENAASPQVCDLLGELLGGCLPFRLIIASRTYPAIDLSHWRIKGLVADISAQELAFTRNDIATFFDGSLSDFEVDELYRRTLGYPAAMQLIRLWWQRQADGNFPIYAFTMQETYLAEYLRARILSDLTAEELRYLVDLSILDEFHAELANAVTNRADSDALCTGLRRLSPFISNARPGGNSYRLHPLIREILDESLVARGHEHHRSLHERAAAYYAGHRQIGAAMRHSCRAGQPDAAAKILIDCGGGVRLLLRDGLNALRVALSILSQTIINRYPRIQLAQIVVLMKDGFLEQSRKRFELLREQTQNFRLDPSASNGNALCIDSIIADVLYRVYRGDVGNTELVEYCAKIVDDIADDPTPLLIFLQTIKCVVHLQNGSFHEVDRATRIAERLCRQHANYFNWSFLYIYKGNSDYVKGQLNSALYHYQQSLHLLRKELPDDIEVGAMCRVFMAEIHHEQHSLAAASKYLHNTLEQVGRTEGWFDIYAAGYKTSAGLAFEHEGLRGSLAVLQNARALTAERGVDKLDALIDIWKLDFMIRAGAHAEAAAFAKSINLELRWPANRDGRDVSWRINDDAALAAIRLALAQGRLSDAQRYLELALDDARQAGRTGSTIRLRLERIVLHVLTEALDVAYEEFVEVLALAAPEKHLTPFLEVRAPLSAWVESVDLGDRDNEFVDKIRRLYREHQYAHLGNGVLNARESEIIHGLAEGRSNKDIARLLNLSENTVKFHMKHIFAKLGVHTRREAVSEAARRKLLREN